MVSRTAWWCRCTTRSDVELVWRWCSVRDLLNSAIVAAMVPALALLVRAHPANAVGNRRRRAPIRHGALACGLQTTTSQVRQLCRMGAPVDAVVPLHTAAERCGAACADAHSLLIKRCVAHRAAGKLRRISAAALRRSQPRLSATHGPAVHDVAQLRARLELGCGCAIVEVPSSCVASALVCCIAQPYRILPRPSPTLPHPTPTHCPNGPSPLISATTCAACGGGA